MMSDQELRQKLKRAFATNPERRAVLEWILTEWDTYASPKFIDHGETNEKEASMKIDGWSHVGFWNRQVNQYLDRAGTYLRAGTTGVEFERSKQAAMKSVTTLIDGLASMVRHHGLPPAPGRSSTEDPIPWEREA
jgi:hypothetical protein